MTNKKKALLAVVAIWLCIGAALFSLRLMRARAHSRLSGEIIGIGVMLRPDGPTQAMKIAGVIPHSPAAEAGLSQGWVIGKIDDVSLEGKKLKECVDLLRGVAGTTVKLELIEPDLNETNTVELVRKKIELPDRSRP